MANKPVACAAARNADAILEALSVEMADCRDVLEIGSGTGQHAVHVAARLRSLRWQTSDLPENHAAIRAWIAESGLDNVLEPLDLDVRSASVDAASRDGVFSANTAHIMAIDAVAAMFDVAARALRRAGIFVLYGPMMIDGKPTTASNEAFDRSLRGADPSMGLRDLAWLDDLAAERFLQRISLYSMPANNFLVTWRRSGEAQS